MTAPTIDEIADDRVRDGCIVLDAYWQANHSDEVPWRDLLDRDLLDTGDAYRCPLGQLWGAQGKDYGTALADLGVLRFEDDDPHRGIDWEATAEVAAALGFEHDTEIHYYTLNAAWLRAPGVPELDGEAGGPCSPPSPRSRPPGVDRELGRVDPRRGHRDRLGDRQWRDHLHGTGAVPPGAAGHRRLRCRRGAAVAHRHPGTAPRHRRRDGCLLDADPARPHHQE